MSNKPNRGPSSNPPSGNEAFAAYLTESVRQVEDKQDDIADRLRGLEHKLVTHNTIGAWTIGITVALAGSLLTWYIPKEIAEAREHSKSDMRELLQPIVVDLAKMNARAATTGDAAPEKIGDALKLGSQSSGEARVVGFETVRAVADRAVKQKVTTDVANVQIAGNAALKASGETGYIVNTAWQTALSLINYRSFLANSERPFPVDAVPITPHPNIDGLFAIDKKVFQPKPDGVSKVMPVVSVAYGSIVKNYALIRLLDLPPLSRTDGPEWITLFANPNQGINLDNVRARNIIFDGFMIHYSGQPTRLENVYSVNCSFLINRGPASIDLGRSLLANANVNFRTS